MGSIHCYASYLRERQDIALNAATARSAGTSTSVRSGRLTRRPSSPPEFAARPQDRVLYLKADRALKYQEVLEAMRLGRAAGTRVLAAVTEQRPPGGRQ